MSSEKICSVEGCGKAHHARGYCNMHYTRLLKNGDIGAAHSLMGARRQEVRREH